MNLLLAVAIPGRLRYLISGSLLALLLGVFCRALNRITAPLGMWRVFRGSCAEIANQGEQYRILVEFTDRSHLHHRAAFCSEHPVAATLKSGSPVRFAIRSEMFTTGNYPRTLDEAEKSGESILLYSPYRRGLLRTISRIALRELLLLAGAFLLFLLGMRVCFPT